MKRKDEILVAYLQIVDKDLVNNFFFFMQLKMFIE